MWLMSSCLLARGGATWERLFPRLGCYSPGPRGRRQAHSGEAGAGPQKRAIPEVKMEGTQQLPSTCSAHGRQRPPREAIEIYAPVLPLLEGPPVLGAAGLLT